MSRHSTMSASEAANRLAIRELVEAYAYCADRRDATGQMALFTPDTHFVVNQYAATMHFVGQSTIRTLTDDRATGEAYCLAHHLTVDGTTRQLMVAALRYYDAFVKVDGAWLFAERLLYVDWVEKRPLSS
jgi:hypothetical protein